ncbi:MBL fold metallo-hydrolase [Bacillus carboniphilus]|uniref:MBL fold metallo-hydrolase n=1 Tax=Bacillus carboniphilus TaxID=86663 RepID=A0ABP3GHU0_9BACI
MKWRRIPAGPLGTNCYVVWNQENNCLIFDPGGDEQIIKAFIKKNNLNPKAILLTHAHFDHIGALEEIRSTYQIPAFVHEKEAKWLLDPALNGSQFFQMGVIRCRPADDFITKEGSQNFGGITLEILETPGHSPGSVSFYFEEGGFVISGDALFLGSIGRTDLPGGDHKQLIKSIHDKLLSLPEDTIVLSGHGEETTIIQEMDHNPFLNGF